MRMEPHGLAPVISISSISLLPRIYATIHRTDDAYIRSIGKESMKPVHHGALALCPQNPQ